MLFNSAGFFIFLLTTLLLFYVLPNPWRRPLLLVGFRGMATVGRNAPCPCGSGRKYKHCCHTEAERLAPVPYPV